TEMGKIVLRILENVESIPTPYLEEPTIDLGKHHYHKEIELAAKKLVNRFNFICKVSGSNWQKGQTKVKIIPPNKLEVYFPFREGFNLALLLTTTAKTEGELRMAGRLVEDFLEA
ncbi:MAG: CRISPR-associated protein Csx14, partial [Candidatus Bathyarchaeia archaeon]